MTLPQIREAYYYHSGKLSDVVRQLAFAGIALVWLFRDEAAAKKVPEDLLWPLCAFVLALALDLLHYAVSALIWGGYARCQERKGTKPDEELAVSPRINWPALAFFWGKAILCLAAYLWLFIRIAGKI